MFGFAKRPNNMLNPARFARWTAPLYAGLPVSINVRLGDTMSTLHISRTRAWTDKFRAYKVLIDGNEVGDISEGAEKTFETPPGNHTVQLKIDWCKSPILNISLVAGQITNMQCGANSNPFLGFLYVTFWRHKYIWLKCA
jgi:hypothetical protein